MCGIAGFVALTEQAPPRRDELLAMAGALFHRGPDEQGIYRDERAGLAHTRLSIIDLSTGQQPLGGLDGSIQLVFNGEIFNYVELREELAAGGRRFRTQSDTEVIVAAYEAWGERCFERFNGQWAVALWDRPKATLVLSRDRLGVRPLHVCEHAGRLYFASEVKAIFAADPTLPRAIDPLGLDQAFTFWGVLAPRTPFRGVSELPPGHTRVVELGGGAVRTRELAYWRPSYPTSPAELSATSLDTAVEATRRTLFEATRLRMVRADVPVGSYLSGGLDSSLVAAMGLRAKGEKFTTFSLRFADAEYDETEYQRLMVQHLGSEHHEVVVSRADIAAAFPDVVVHGERPILRTAPAPLFLLSKLVRDAGVKVVLTGEGADEMFAGYDLFREGKVRRFWARHPSSKLRPRLLDRLYPYLTRSPTAQRAMAMQFFGRDLEHAASPGFAHQTRWHAAAALKRLFSADVRAELAGKDAVGELLADLPSDFGRWTPLAQDQYLEVRTLLSPYLLSAQGDRMLMAHAVEGRFPFLDRDVVELANHLRDRDKLRVLDEKHVLKRAAEGLVPEPILRRKKQPYRAPDALSFAHGAPERIGDALSDEAVRRAGLFEPAAVAKLWAKVRGADVSQFSNADNMALVGVLSTMLLHQELCERPIAVRPIVPRTDLDRVADAG